MNNIWRIRCLVAGLIVLLVGAEVVSASVWPLRNSKPNTTIRTIYVPDDYAKIQWAVDNASAGDTIIIRNGTYRESDILLNKELLIVGEGSPIIDGGGKTFFIVEQHVTIEGLSIVNASTGIYIVDGPVEVLNCTFRDVSTAISTRDSVYWQEWGSDIKVVNCKFDNLGEGLRVYLGHNIYVLNSTFTECGDCVYIVTIGAVNYVGISGNLFDRCKYGVTLQGVSCVPFVEVSKNTFRDNHAAVRCRENVRLWFYLNNLFNSSFYIPRYPDFLKLWSNTMDYVYNRREYRSCMGNYWDDYKGSDSNGDGIGDSPYYLDDPYHFLADNYPLVQPWENYFVTNLPKPNVSIKYEWENSYIIISVRLENEGEKSNFGGVHIRLENATFVSVDKGSFSGVAAYDITDPEAVDMNPSAHVIPVEGSRCIEMYVNGDSAESGPIKIKPKGAARIYYRAWLKDSNDNVRNPYTGELEPYIARNPAEFMPDNPPYNKHIHSDQYSFLDYKCYVVLLLQIPTPVKAGVIRPEDWGMPEVQTDTTKVGLISYPKSEKIIAHPGGVTLHVGSLASLGIPKIYEGFEVGALAGATASATFKTTYKPTESGTYIIKFGADGNLGEVTSTWRTYSTAAYSQGLIIFVHIMDLTEGKEVAPPFVKQVVLRGAGPEELVKGITEIIIEQSLAYCIEKTLTLAGVTGAGILVPLFVETCKQSYDLVDLLLSGFQTVTEPIDSFSITVELEGGHEYEICVELAALTVSTSALTGRSVSDLYVTFALGETVIEKFPDISPDISPDVNPPRVQLVEYPPIHTNDSVIEFSWEGCDDQTPSDELKFSYKLDDHEWSEWSSQTSIVLSELSEGMHTFKVRVKDYAGNINEIKYEFIVDRTPPLLTVLSPSNGDVLLVESECNISYEYSDITRVLFDIYYYDGDMWHEVVRNWDGTVYTWRTPDKPGDYKLKIVARDAAGSTNEEIVSFKVASGAPHNILYKAKWITLGGDFTVYDLPVTVATLGQYKVVFEAIEVDYDQILIGVYKNDEKVGEWIAGVEGEGFSYQMGVFDDGNLIVILLDAMVALDGEICANMIIANNLLSVDATISPKDLEVVESSKAVYQVSSSKSYDDTHVFSSSKELLEKVKVDGDQLVNLCGQDNEWEYYSSPYNVYAGGIWYGKAWTDPPNKVEISTSGLSGRMWFGVAAFERAQVNYGEGFLIYPVYLLVNPNKKPVASFDFVPSEPAIGEEITFISSSYDPDGGEVECRWDFGDGTTAVGEVVHHAYGEAGTYKVTLTVVDDEGAEVSTTKDVVISDALVDLVIEPEGGTWKVGDVIQFKAIANYASGKEEDVTMEASWYVDNTSVLEPAKCKGCYIAKSPGIALVTAIYKSVSASVTVYVRSEWIEEKYVPKPEQVSLNHWIENDHSKINATIELICSPCVKYNVSWSKMQKNGNVFTANVQILKFSKSNCSVIGAYRCPVKHTYDLGVLEPGTYIFILKVWDEEVKRLKFNISKQNLAPIADFAYSPQSPRVCEAITFDASSSYDPDGSIVSYKWDFGDGNKTEGKVVTHAYSQAGSYIVTLTVTDDNGATNTTSEVVTVEDWNPWNDPDSDGGEKITTPELQEAIHCWLNDEPAPKTGAEITTERLQEVIHLWLQG